MSQVPAKTSGAAIASLVLGILGLGLPAVICGHIALSNTKEDPALGGRGLAIAGLVLGYVGIVMFMFWIAVVFGLLGTSGGSGSFLYEIF